MDLLNCFGNMAYEEQMFRTCEKINKVTDVEYLFIDCGEIIKTAAVAVTADIAIAMDNHLKVVAPGWATLRNKYTYLPENNTTDLAAAVQSYQDIFYGDFGSTGLELLDVMIIEKVLEVFDRFLSLFTVKRGVMIATDGVTPIADIMHKRERNYMNEFYDLYRKRIAEEYSDGSDELLVHEKAIKFNYQKQNPGMQFMKQIFIELGKKYPDAEVSDCEKPGETWKNFSK